MNRIALVAALAAIVPITAFAAERSDDASWAFFGGDVHNTRYQRAETAIGSANVHRLRVKWRFTPSGDVSATPSVDRDAIYVPDWGGHLYKIDAATGKALWTVDVATPDYPNAVARTTPAFDGDAIVIGDQPNRLDASHAPAHIIALSKATGKRLWSTQIDESPSSMITQSPIVYGGRIYVGVSSNEEVLALQPAFQCCTFRGSLVALDARTGKVVWKTYTVPVPFTGGSIWGSTVAVDEKRGLAYATTGNNYGVPDSVATCQRNATRGSACLPAENHVDSVLAFDLLTGAIRWSHRLSDGDAWIAPCAIANPGMAGCPDPAGVDEDFGSGPNLYSIDTQRGPIDVVGAGQKNGRYTTLDAGTGAIVWQTGVGPGGLAGGIQWGSATDGNRIYVADANSYHRRYTLTSGRRTTGGAWSALVAETGRILWQTADPRNGLDIGPTTVANGVMYAGSMESHGSMYALDASSGRILWTFDSGASVASGPAIANGTVYWGSGYTHGNVAGPKIGTPNRAVYAFSLPRS